MILGLGCDIVRVSRFKEDKNFLLRFIRKYLTKEEIKELETRLDFNDLPKLRLSLATRFCAKEAISKALGTGFQDGISLKDIEITHDKLGAPKVTLFNKAKARALLLSNNQTYRLHLTLSNEKEYTNAVSILEVI